MSEAFVGQIKMFAGNFAPRGWAFCDGQLLAVSSNDALFSLLGTIYGGDGETTFGLPDLRGRVPIHAGSGPGMSDRRLGSKAGSENATIAIPQLAAHHHGPFNASTATGNESTPSGNLVAESPSIQMYLEDAPAEALHNATVEQIGGGQSHDNMMPFQCIHFIIALFGVYPSRN